MTDRPTVRPLRCSTGRAVMRPMCWMLLAASILTGGEARSFAEEAAAEFDVVVYSATPAGVCAAVAAKREGANVCLVEPLDLIGGMMSSGLSFSDSNQTARECLLGLFDEVHRRIERVYRDRGVELPYRVAVKDNAHWTYEPHVAEKVFNDLLREAGVRTYLEHALQSVEKRGARITQLKTERGLKVRGRVFIDASYEGDLMAAAKVSYQVGREAPATYQETLAGHQFSKPAVAVSPLSEKGNLLPLMTGRSAGDADQQDRKIMTYSFRLCLTDDPQRRIPFAKPADYDASEFELLRRYLAKFPDAPFPVDLYPIPGGKVDANNGIGKQISLGLIGANWDWPDATPQRRREIWLQHRAYTEGLFWFLANDPAVPEKIRATARRYGLANDEFARFGHWPPMLYVREARRMTGVYVLTEADILQNVAKPDCIAVGSFPIDSHDCQRIATDDGLGFINEGTIFPKHLAARPIGQPHQIPYRAIVPRQDECDNLLVPVCLSASHVAFSSVRVEPTWMVLGQSSGIAAAMIAGADIAAQDAQYELLKSRLMAKGVVLTLP